MKRLSFIMTIILVFQIGISQITFERQYNIGYFAFFNSVLQTNDNEYIIVGGNSIYGVGFDIIFIKANNYGDVLSMQTYGQDFSWCAANSIQKTSDNGYIIAGSTSTPFPYDNDIYVIKTDENGDTLWTKTFGGINDDYGQCICQTIDNNYVCVGYTNSSNINQNVYLLKIDENGNEIWAKSFGGIYNERGSSVQQTNDNGFIITGSIVTNGLDSDVMLFKTNENGDSLWMKQYGGSENEGGNAVCQTYDNGYIILGTTNSFGAGESDVYLIKTNESGDTLWTRTVGWEDNDYGSSIDITDDGYIICGSTCDSTGNNDVLLIKTNESGDTIWTRTFGGSVNDFGNDVKQTNDNGYIVCGIKNIAGYLIKTNENGLITTIDEISKKQHLRINVFPNPFSFITTMEYHLEKASTVIIRIFNNQGKLIEELIHQAQSKGAHKIQWNTEGMPAGIYYYRIHAGEQVDLPGYQNGWVGTGKMIKIIR